jgi:hypothetical protein
MTSLMFVVVLLFCEEKVERVMRKDDVTEVT